MQVWMVVSLCAHFSRLKPTVLGDSVSSSSEDSLPLQAAQKEVASTRNTCRQYSSTLTSQKGLTWGRCIEKAVVKETDGTGHSICTTCSTATTSEPT